MISSLFNLSVISEWVAFIAAMFLLNRKTGIWRLFIYFMLFTLYIETTGWYVSDKRILNNNHWIYNFYNVVANSFYLLIMANSSQLVKSRKGINYSIISLAVFALVNMDVQLIWQLNNYTEAFGNILCVIFCSIFFIRISQDYGGSDLKGNEYVWFAAGLLFDSLASAVENLFYNTLKEIHEKNGWAIFRYTMNALDVFFYLSFIIAFVCRRRNSR